MATDTNDESVETETRGTELAETEARPDLVWDKEVPGLCVRVYGNGSESFTLVYRVDDRQRFVRIGKTPVWSLETARIRANELNSIVDQGGDPTSAANREPDKIPVESARASTNEIDKSNETASANPEPVKFSPVDDVIRYIAEHLREDCKPE
jgi:hypothetical protein